MRLTSHRTPSQVTNNRRKEGFPTGVSVLFRHGIAIEPGHNTLIWTRNAASLSNQSTTCVTVHTIATVDPDSFSTNLTLSNITDLSMTVRANS